MNIRWIAPVLLIVSVSCSCQASRGAEYQASKRESSAQANDASEQVKELSTSQLKDWMTSGQKFTLIDVREDNEWQAGHAAAALHITRWTLPEKIGTVVPDKTARIVLYCLGGARSKVAAESLQSMGYTNVFSLAGGFKNYQAASLPVQK
jgi:rhodanese-related sulfurtransferase